MFSVWVDGFEPVVWVSGGLPHPQGFAADEFRAVSWSSAKIPWSNGYNYTNSMYLVGLEGLEPSTKGFTLPRTGCLCITKLKNPKRFPVALMYDDRNRACADPGCGRFRTGCG